ncbi:hypothetical protein FB45DRAFT_1049855 [Roridomyces roridus]|uniref:Uncharacterized protein n=1 Tax=Roridomyces roridus TaxID=1738132 RepID=A0AAD7CI17_9AGAR|nr:hypothetical protein FB45DRAFT_1049855 [Roridomyces roridus]
MRYFQECLGSTLNVDVARNSEEAALLVDLQTGLTTMNLLAVDCPHVPARIYLAILQVEVIHRADYYHSSRAYLVQPASDSEESTPSFIPPSGFSVLGECTVDPRPIYIYDHEAYLDNPDDNNLLPKEALGPLLTRKPQLEPAEAEYWDNLSAGQSRVARYHPGKGLLMAPREIHVNVSFDLLTFREFKICGREVGDSEAAWLFLTLWGRTRDIMGARSGCA